MKKLIIPLFIILIISCSKSDESIPIVQYSISVQVTPAEGGAVSPSLGSYNEGETVSLLATPSAEYVFKNWSGGASGTSNPTTVVMSSNKSITAVFEKKQYALTIEIEGEGTVEEELMSSKPSGDYPSGSSVKLTAVPADGWEFIEWSGDLTGSDNPVTISIDNPKNVKAIFQQIPYPKLNVSSNLANILEEGFKVTDINAEITSSSFNRTIQFSIDSDTSSGTFDSIPPGNYDIQIEAFQHSTLIFRGLSDINIELGEDKNIEVELSFVQLIESKGELITGIVPADYIADKFFGNASNSNWSNNEPLNTLNQNGINWVRAGITNLSSENLKNNPSESWRDLKWESEYWSSLEWTEQIFKEAQGLGMKLNLFFFYSDEAAFAELQNAPSNWKNLSVEATADLIEDYTYKTTLYFKNKGYDIDIYDIGNEIGKGILNFLPGQRLSFPDGEYWDMNYWINSVWKTEAILLKAAIKGLKRADPDAEIVLHIAELTVTDDNIFVKTFYETMYLEGVEYDYAGLTYPYSYYFGDDARENEIERPYFNSNALNGVINFIGALGKKVIFSEYSFPHSTTSTSESEPAGYSYTPNGQAQWVSDFLNFTNNNPIIKGSFYFYPEHFSGSNYSAHQNLDSNGLYENSSTPLPAMSVFKSY